MPRPRKTPSRREETVGDRIRKVRLARGLTQAQLGKRVGLSQRMVTYYEVRGVALAPNLLVKRAHVLDVTVDDLLGHKARSKAGPEAPTNIQLWRRINKLQDLPPQDRKTVFRMIDMMAEARRKAG